MKSAVKLGLRFVLLLVIISNAVAVLAQDSLTDTLPESAYHIDVPKKVVNVYSNFVPYVLFGIVILLILYVSYRFWHDNRTNGIDHTPHHP